MIQKTMQNNCERERESLGKEREKVEERGRKDRESKGETGPDVEDRLRGQTCERQGFH
jgi:hypothetical protein